MHRPTARSVLLAACAAALLTARASAGDGAAPAAVGEPAWVASAREAKFSDAAIAQLRERHLLLTREESKQIFEPYLSAKRPLVTTDSVLAAYHFLLEASVARLEAARAARLPGLLRAVWDALPAAAAKAKAPDDATRRAATLRATRTLAVALRLLGAETPGLAEDDAKIVEAEVRAIVAARGQGVPAWLEPFGEAFPCIDYDAHRPRGFYDADDMQRAYFRAVRWLQTVVFREDLPVEKLAGEMLQRADLASGTKLGDFAEAFFALVGRARREPVLSSSRRTGSLEEVLEEARPTAEERALANQRARTPTIRLVFPPGEPPENPLLREIAEPNTRRPLPDALDLGIALGSSYAETAARTAPTVTPRPKLAALDVAMTGRSLLAAYLRTIGALVDAPEPDAPAFLGNDAWRAKGLATAVAGWAQARHTFVLQAEENAGYLCATNAAPGFVEPDPEFFERLGALSRRTLAQLQDDGAFGGEIAAQQVRIDLREFAAWLVANPDPDIWDMHARARAGHEWAVHLGADVRTAFVKDAPAKEREAARRALAADLRRRADELPSPLPRRIAEAFEDRGVVLVAAWRELADTSARLASMAHRQLRRRPWDDEDVEFFRGYGRRLARLHLYFGQSWVHPRDDAPCTASVQTLVDGDGAQRSWHVGVGRPRTIVVLWPTADGEDVLCTGAVLPFHETVEDHRLTDDEWRARFAEGAARPRDPAWLAPALGPGK